MNGKTFIISLHYIAPLTSADVRIHCFTLHGAHNAFISTYNGECIITGQTLSRETQHLWLLFEKQTMTAGFS